MLGKAKPEACIITARIGDFKLEALVSTMLCPGQFFYAHVKLVSIL